MADKDLQKAFQSYAEDNKLSPVGMKKWFEEAAILGKETGITETDLDTVIIKISKDEEGIDFEGLKECIDTLAKEKNLEPKELIEELAIAGARIRQSKDEAKLVQAI